MEETSGSIFNIFQFPLFCIIIILLLGGCFAAAAIWKKNILSIFCSKYLMIGYCGLLIILAFGSYLLPEKRLLKPISAVQEQAYGQAEKELFSLSIEELSQSIDEGRINEKSNIIRNTKMTFPSESDQLEIILQNSNQAIWIEKKEADDGIIEANYISYFKFKDYDMTRIALPPTFSKNENQMTIEVPPQTIQFIAFDQDFAVSQFTPGSASYQARNFSSFTSFQKIYLRIPENIQVKANTEINYVKKS
ncbi:hypothetical protein Sgly_1750 [Syntrophobotulus glycolicus DSM 8271]|uniref:Uncharacterized protein n=1 Tax=Syntrophobotulus glycolicus (strain DSM 8271 / FlGlyR) TaxID=645991 RepID=F0SZ10_SYNGF|nr:hypothetical protein [Syntrophobotulus glycolicus]ADY56047.1 hypothetical protein Sgly_1750 [Syntrophobotulus glycolicus DSM 8271]